MSTFERWPDPKWVLSYDQLLELKDTLQQDTRKIEKEFADLEAKAIKIKAECFDHPERSYIPLELKGMEKVKQHLQRWEYENAAWRRAIDYVLGKSFHFCRVNPDSTLKEGE